MDSETISFWNEWYVILYMPELVEELFRRKGIPYV